MTRVSSPGGWWFVGLWSPTYSVTAARGRGRPGETGEKGVPGHPGDGTPTLRPPYGSGRNDRSPTGAPDPILDKTCSGRSKTWGCPRPHVGRGDGRRGTRVTGRSPEPNGGGWSTVCLERLTQGGTCGWWSRKTVNESGHQELTPYKTRGPL